MLIYTTIQITSLTWGRKSSRVAILPYIGTSSMGCKKAYIGVIKNYMKSRIRENTIKRKCIHDIVPTYKRHGYQQLRQDLHSAQTDIASDYKSAIPFVKSGQFHN